jgi:hypothetical protein
MNAELTKTVASMTPAGYGVELRRRLERLEILRGLASLRSDRWSVTLIDKQIKFAVTEWINAFVAGYENRIATSHEGYSMRAQH